MSKNTKGILMTLLITSGYMWAAVEFASREPFDALVLLAVTMALTVTYLDYLELRERYE